MHARPGWDGMGDIINTTKMVLTITFNLVTELGYHDPRCWTGIKGIWHLNEIDWESVNLNWQAERLEFSDNLKKSNQDDQKRIIFDKQ